MAVKKETTKLTLPLFDVTGKETSSIELPMAVFGVTASPLLLAQAVRVYRTNQRQGTQSTKTRSEVIGSTKKIYRQKGTGRARHGAKKAPIFVGGGITFGPKPRIHEARLNKKQRKLALFATLSAKAKAQAMKGLAASVGEMEPKTKGFMSLIKTMGIADKKVLLVLTDMQQSGMVKAARNLGNVEITGATTLNAYQILANDTILIQEQAVKTLVDHFVKQS